jgi:hypothetical protein
MASRSFTTRRACALADVRLAAAVVASIAAVGCESFNQIGPTACDRSEEGNPAVLYTEGTVSGTDTLIYKTSEFDGELLWFPGGMRYELEHKLGTVPEFWDAYLSFEQYGTLESTIAPAAGNQTELVEMNETSLIVANKTCADFWLVVIAGASVSSEEPSDP